MQKLVWKNSLGDEIDLTSGSYGITEWEGFSNTSLNIQSQQVPFQDGGVFLDALMEQRELSVTLKMQDNGNLEERYRMRRELIHALNPKLGEGYLIYTNDFTSKRIKCVPQIPLFPTHNSNDSGTPPASLVWTACEPYWEDLEETNIKITKGLFSIQNNGDIPTSIKININSNMANDLKINSLTTNKKLQFNAPLQNININTGFGEKSITSKTLAWKGDIRSDLKSICYSSDLNLYVAVGESGAVLTSNNSINWVLQNNSGTIIDLNSVCYSSELNIFVAVGYTTGKHSTIITSTDGINWTERVNDTLLNKYLTSICYSTELDLFVAVGYLSEKGIIITSIDGINWSLQETLQEEYSRLYSVCYSSELNIFVAVGEQGGIYTSNNGINWTKQIRNVEYFLLGVCYSAELGLFVVVGGNNNNGRIITSSDGVNWTERRNLQKRLDFVFYSSEKKLFVTGGYNGKIVTSSDGVNWNEKTIEDIHLRGGCYILEQGVFAIVGNSGAILTSNNGINWTSNIAYDNYKTFRGIYYSTEFDIFIIVGSNGTILTSNNGINWTDRVSGVNWSLSAICYSVELNLFVIVGYNGTILTSNNGINWTDRVSGITNNLESVCYSVELGLFVAVGRNNAILSSNDGINWTVRQNGGTNIYSVCYSSELNIFVAVGDYVYSSTDGINWTEISTPIQSLAVCYSPELNIFVAVGSNARLQISKDGINWNYYYNIGIEDSLWFISYSADMGVFIALGNNGRIVTSSDGINWTVKDSGVNTNLRSIAYSPKQDLYVVAGNKEVVLLSYYKDVINVISELTQDSDMNFNLVVGDNKLLISAMGMIRGDITYRQKYIGV